jgi:flagellar biogenesis protein FliO
VIEAEYLRTLAALLAVLGLLGLGAWLLPRFARLLGPRAHGGQRLAAIESRWLDGRTRLLVVRWDASEHLLLVTPQAATLIASREGGEPEALARAEAAGRGP